MDFLIFLLVEPLKIFYEGLYETIQYVIPNLGAAIIGLSCVTVMFMAPLEKLTSGAIAREKLTASILEPQIRDIKKHLKGSERQAALSRLYYRYRYNPLYAIRSSFSILIQLPFLVGAYLMLSDYEPLRGIAFGPLKDLGDSDRLLFGFNLLPILMTLINFATVRISHLSRRDAIQAVVIAFLFLVLLYQAPSSLLLYWTVNNVLHFLKALFKQMPRKLAAFPYCKLKLAESLSKAESRFGKATAVFLVLFALDAVLFAGNALVHNHGWMRAIILNHVVMMFVLATPLLRNTVASLMGNEQGSSSILWTAASLLLLALVFFVSAKNISQFIASIPKTSHGLTTIIIILLMVGNHGAKLKTYASRLCDRGRLFNLFRKNEQINHTEGVHLYLVSIAILAATIFAVIPLRFYVQNYRSIWFTGSSLVIVLILATLLTYVITTWIAKRILMPKWSGSLMLMLATCMVIQSCLWPQQIKEFIGNAYDWLGEPLTWCNLILWLTLLTLGTWLTLKNRLAQEIAVVLNVVLLVSVAANALWQGYQTWSNYRTYETIAFTKNNQFVVGKKNIIVFVLDALSQEVLDSIQETNRTEYEELFRGFIRYTNNVGSGPTTSYAVPYIFSGKFIKKNEELARYIKRIYDGHTLLDDAFDNGYFTRIYAEGRLFPSIIANKIENAVIIKTWGYAKMNAPALQSLAQMILYNIAPDIFRSTFTMNTAQFERGRPEPKSEHSLYREDDAQFYRDFNTNPFIKKAEKNYFIYYHLLGAHAPFRMDASGNRIPNNQPEGTQHDQVLGCLRQLQRMFNRLKEIDKFQDSTIVVMSDHGKHGAVKSSFPVLLVKKAREGLQNPIRHSDIPVGHKDLLTSIFALGEPRETKNRIVLDRDLNLWQAPDQVSAIFPNTNNFTQVTQVESKTDSFTTTGFGLDQLAGRTIKLQPAMVSFRDTKERYLQFSIRKVKNNAKMCNGYLTFENAIGVARVFVDDNGSENIILKHRGPQLRITPECEIKDNPYESYVFNRMHYGLFDVVEETEVQNNWQFLENGYWIWNPFANHLVRWSASQLRHGSHTSIINGFAVSSANGATFLTYGPYVQMRKGKFRLSITYRSSLADNEEAGAWDITGEMGKFVLEKGSLKGTNGNLKTENIHFYLANEKTDFVEFRTISNKASSIEISELSVKQLENEQGNSY